MKCPPVGACQHLRLPGKKTHTLPSCKLHDCDVPVAGLQAQHKHMFEPSLPHATIQAIDGLGFGVVNKLFVDFGPSSVASPDPEQQDFCTYGPAGGSNADHSRSGQQPDKTRPQTADAATKGDAQPLTANEAVSYYLLWNRNPQDFQPALHSQHDPADDTTAEASGRDPLQDIHLSNKMNAAQQEHGATSPATKGPGDKGPESHVVTAPDHAQHTDSEPATSSQDGITFRSNGSQHELPTWAQGAYTLRFAGSEFVQGTTEDAATAANRCGVVWMTGEEAQSMEAASDTELHKHMAAILQQFPALALPSQFRIHRSSWGSDPLFRGSYSYGSASTTGDECRTLTKPLETAHGTDKVLKVLFAGECCHPKYFGCTHGAYLTGQSQAQKLLNSWPSCKQMP